VTRYRTCTGITSTFLIVRIACRNDTRLEVTRLTARAMQRGLRTFAASGLSKVDYVIDNVVLFRRTSTLVICALQNNFSSVVMFSVFQRSFSTKSSLLIRLEAYVCLCLLELNFSLELRHTALCNNHETSTMNQNTKN
jgi:hypothetical protein